MPTLLDISGIAAPEAMQGQSLLPLIASSAGSGDAEAMVWYPDIAVTEKHAEDNTDDPDDFTNALESFAMVSSSGEWKLVHNVAGRERLGRDEFELYRHQDDPLDLKNVAAEHPAVVEELRAELEIWKTRVTQEQLPKGEEGAKDLPADQLDQLRNLGYIQ
jgi:arylsulfatase